MRKLLGAAVLAMVSPLACSADLRDARTILQHIEGASAESASQSEPARLLADIQQFRLENRQLEPAAAAQRWFDQLDRARKAPQAMTFDASTFDMEVSRPVGIRSVLASIPSPAAWPELRAIATTRAQKSQQPDLNPLAIQLLTEVLNNDAAGVTAALAKIESLTTRLAPGQREQLTNILRSARMEIASTYGTQADAIAAYEAVLSSAESGDSPGSLETPDLVGMVGAERATPLLRRAVTSPAMVYLRSGVDTRRLARQLALDNIAAMSIPQWALVDSIDAVPLYEAIQEKFGTQAAAASSMEDYRTEMASNDADIYYLLGMIVEKQQQKAEAALTRIGRKGGLHLPQPAVKALREAQQSEALVEFLHGVLSKQPEMQAWDVFIEQASFVGRSEQALELIRSVKKRPGLPAHVGKELERRELEALLANNRVDEAIASLRKQIAAKPPEQSADAQLYLANATRLARIGRLLERKDLVKEGLAAARSVLGRPRGPEDYETSGYVTQIYEIYRRTGEAAGAQEIAVAELARAPGQEEQAQQFGYAAANLGKRKALIELVGIYVAANRPQDSLMLLRQARQWGARDLGELIDEKDSLGTPVGYLAGRALAETGERDAALSVLRALLERLPGYDPAYELLLKLSGADAIAELDRLYLRDQFEERPLIWKARALLDAGQLQEAEDVIRRAIAIDPSDGEQPANDRLRAYAVLADIVAARGQQKDAATYRQALQAIRISEQADQFHAAGLYDRAFAMYRDSLARFSDAYCIQSRLAIQLSRQGRHQEAVAHYRRAYELMPDSFGRVESHCFGCENVFADPNAQSIAEQVFTQALERDKQKPQAHYLLGYLRKEQGRYEQALQSFRNAVALDDSYLNAWKQLNDLSELTYIDATEREIFQQKLLQLDPKQNHVRYRVDSVRDIARIWNELDRLQAAGTKARNSVFVLEANARKLDEALASLPPELRAQSELYASFVEGRRDLAKELDPRHFLLQHAMTRYVAQMMGANDEY